jgi:hypothetical protein
MSVHSSENVRLHSPTLRARAKCDGVGVRKHTIQAKRKKVKVERVGELWTDGAEIIDFQK